MWTSDDVFNKLLYLNQNNKKLKDYEILEAYTYLTSNYNINTTNFTPMETSPLWFDDSNDSSIHYLFTLKNPDPFIQIKHVSFAMLNEAKGSVYNIQYQDTKILGYD